MKKKTASKKAATPSAPKFGLGELAAVNRRAIASAGPRYFPNIKADFPDLRIEAFDDAIAGLVGGEEFRALVEDIKQDIEKEWSNVSGAFHDAREYQGKLAKPQPILRALDELAASAPGCGAEAAAKIRQRAGRAHKKASALLDKIQREREKQFRKSGHFPPRDPDNGVIAYKSALGRAMDFMPEADYSFMTGKPVHMRANPCGLQQAGFLVLHGEWGMGKTHSLCALAKAQEGKGLPVLLALAKDFAPGDSPGDALARHTGLADDFGGLLRRLDALGRKAGVRALLLVDGVNENNPNNLWERELGKMLKRVRCFPFVGLVVSYRVPFRHGLSESELLETPRMRHEGFRKIPFEAQEAFLKYYNVSLPRVPPMAEEFSRPLTLKLICEAFKHLSRKDQRKGFDGLASGQKGMTFILERYVRERAKAVAKMHKEMSPKIVWDCLIKDKMASYMADNLTEEMPVAFLLKAIRGRFSVGLLKARTILRDMAKEGIVILSRGIPWEHCNPMRAGRKRRRRVLVQMPYQRFGDHIIARHFCTSPSTWTAALRMLCGAVLIRSVRSGGCLRWKKTGMNFAPPVP